MHCRVAINSSETFNKNFTNVLYHQPVIYLSTRDMQIQLDATPESLHTALSSEINVRACVQSKLHIAVVSETLPPDINGVAMTMGKLITRLKYKGHRVDLSYPQLTRQADNDCEVAGYDDTIVRGYPIPFYNSMKFGLCGTAVFLDKWKLNRPDIVHIVTEGPLGVAALLAARKLGITVASGFHTNFHQYTGHYRLGTLGSTVMRYLRWFHNKTDITFVPTSALASELTDNGIVNARVLSRGVDTEFFSPNHRSAELRKSFGANEHDPVLLYVGRLAAEKNIDLTIRAFERFRKIQSNAKMVFVGDGPLLHYVQNHPIRPIVCGSKTGEELASHYASSDIFLFPSLSETFGNVTLEAMASGLAVVAFDYAAAREHIVNMSNGIAAEHASEEAFINGVEALARQPLLNKSMGFKARSSVKNFDWDDICDHLVDMYYELTSSIK